MNKNKLKSLSSHKFFKRFNLFATRIAFSRETADSPINSWGLLIVCGIGFVNVSFSLCISFMISGMIIIRGGIIKGFSEMSILSSLEMTRQKRLWFFLRAVRIEFENIKIIQEI